MSEEKKNKETQHDESEKKKDEKKENVEELLKKQVEEYKEKFNEAEKNFENSDKEREEWKNKYYSAYADMANLRKQVEKETSDFKKYAVESFLKELIPTLDSFDLALKNIPTDENLKSHFEGMQMIHNKLLNSLMQANVTIIDPKVDDEYDPNTMQAFSTVDGKEDNKIAEVFTKGYKLYDHLLRPAGVIVTTKVVEEVKEKNNEIHIESEEK